MSKHPVYIINQYMLTRTETMLQGDVLPSGAAQVNTYCKSTAIVTDTR